MIPPLNPNGYLPPGIHPSTLDELLARFGHGSEQRLAQADSLRWLVPLCLDPGIERMLINGSFVTSAPEPSDVVCVLLVPANYDESTPTAPRTDANVASLRSLVQMANQFREEIVRYRAAQQRRAS